MTHIGDRVFIEETELNNGDIAPAGWYLVVGVLTGVPKMIDDLLLLESDVGKFMSCDDAMNTKKYGRWKILESAFPCTTMTICADEIVKSERAKPEQKKIDSQGRSGGFEFL